MSAQTAGPDFEGVLRDHVVHGGSSGGRWNADCLAVDCHWTAHGETGGFWATVEAHRAQGMWDAESRTVTHPSEDNPYRAAQVAPSRVPGEGS